MHENRLRAFVQLEHATATDPHAPLDATWRRFRDTSAYLEYEIGGATGAAALPLSVRAGRQLLGYGSKLMIDDRSGLDTEMPFDGARARSTAGSCRTDLFAVRPVDVAPYGFDDLADRSSDPICAIQVRAAVITQKSPAFSYGRFHVTGIRWLR